MPFGGNDWLALTQETTLEPELPICDPYHRFWDLRPACLPYQRYLFHELLADIHSGHDVRLRTLDQLSSSASCSIWLRRRSMRRCMRSLAIMGE